MFCSIGYRSVRNGIFEVVGDRFIEEVARDVSIFHTQILTSIRPHRRDLHRLEGPFRIESVDYGISYRHNPRITDHAVCLASVQVPYRQLALFLMDMQHRVYEFSVSVRLEKAVQRHSGAVGVPERECCI